MARRISQDATGTAALRQGGQLRRGLRRGDAAIYIGVSPSKFDQFVLDGTMPRPLRAGGCVIWDVRQLDQAFDDLVDTTDIGITTDDREMAAQALAAASRA